MLVIFHLLHLFFVRPVGVALMYDVLAFGGPGVGGFGLLLFPGLL